MISFYYFASDGKSHADATTHGIGVQRTERNAFGYVNFHLISKLNQINEFLGSRSGGITRNGAHNTATLDTDAKKKHYRVQERDKGNGGFVQLIIS